MGDEIPEATPPLSPEEELALARLSRRDVEVIDAAILSCALPHWQKVAKVVFLTVETLEARYPQLSYISYAMRIQDLVDQGLLESQGDLDYMRFSEVRLPEGR